MRVLLSAYACAPNQGSEPGVGWNWARQVARFHDVWVLTRAADRGHIEDALMSEPNARRIRFCYIDLPKWACPRIRSEVLEWGYYYLWQFLAWRVARRLHGKQKFDVAHHVTYASWRVPSLLWTLGIPFIWGPIGGGQSAPPGFFRAWGWRGFLGETVREFFQRISCYDPLVRLAFAKARLVLAANSTTAAFIEPLCHTELRQMFETGVVTESYGFDSRGTLGQRWPLELLWVGKMEPRKALPLLLDAIAAIPHVELHLIVIGDGRERQRWERICRDLCIAHRVTFKGRLPYLAVQERYPEADVLVFTSLRDTSGNVVLEAMASGCPVVVLDWAGPRELVPEGCGIKIKAQSYAQVVRDLSTAIERLAADGGLRRRLGEAGKVRVADTFCWDRKGERICSVYQAVVKGRG